MTSVTSTSRVLTSTTFTPSPTSTTSQITPLTSPPVSKSGLLSLPLHGITVLSILIVIVIIYVVRRNRITLTNASPSGAVLLDDKTDTPILLSHSHPLVNAASTLPRSIHSLGRAVSIKSTRSIRSNALCDDPELGVPLIPSLPPSMKSLGRSSTCPDDHFVADGDAVPVPVIPLSRSMSVRDAEEDRPTSVKSLGRSMSYKLYQKAVKADLMGRREEGVPSLSRSVGVVSLDRGRERGRRLEHWKDPGLMLWRMQRWMLMWMWMMRRR
ncbi:hypothetical protein BC829DRAFT_398075 [Chytridium lagenaria]|nr:hypothetical protein BC829DRAFT_398075 [Chytridium lagenaria]